MDKTVYRMRPMDYWRIDEQENWYAQMAAKGLHLKKTGRLIIQFIQGDPKDMNYRIDVTLKEENKQEQVDIRENNGWDYVTGDKTFSVFASPIERNVSELVPNKAQIDEMKELEKKLSRNFKTNFVCFLFIFLLNSSLLFIDRTPTLALINMITIHQMLLTLLFGYITLTSFQTKRAFQSLNEKHIERRLFQKNSTLTKTFIFHVFINLFFIIIIISSTVSLFISDTKTLPETDGHLPFVRLADIEKDSMLLRENDVLNNDDIDWLNSYTYDWSPLATVQYEVDEHGTIPGKMWTGESEEYSPSLYTNVYSLTFPIMVEPLLKDIQKRYTTIFELNTFKQVSHPKLDHLFIHDESNMKQVLAAKGKAVMYVRYFGDVEMEVVVEAVVDKIHLIENK